MINQNSEMNQKQSINEQLTKRRKKLEELRQHGQAFPNDFKPKYLALDLYKYFEHKMKEDLITLNKEVSIAGRMIMKRLMGQASFIQIMDRSGKIQVYLRKQNLPADLYEQFKNWDLGDTLGIEGVLFKTQTGELSIKVRQARLLVKALRPLPDKWHGLKDQEACYRQRYLDLIANEKSKKIFKIRAKLTQYIRNFLNEREFLEVETPMMQSIPGGATARPFETHHNALDMKLYMRISPELYLKRLVVGGFERVFEINRNFRNEGLSTRHNPEFTMVEFYQAYADYNDLMNETEILLKGLTKHLFNDYVIEYQKHQLDFSKPFDRLTIVDSILKYCETSKKETLEDIKQLQNYFNKRDWHYKPNWSLGKLQLEWFEKEVEQKLIQPTFIINYPKEISPLARCSDNDPELTDRFELIIAGCEIANGFSELNDPEDQAERFHRQVQAKDAGDLEAMHFDDDYIKALEHGMPPTAGEGIGIDRLVMIYTDSISIRDVILFPHMRHVIKKD